MEVLLILTLYLTNSYFTVPSLQNPCVLEYTLNKHLDSESKAGIHSSVIPLSYS